MGFSDDVGGCLRYHDLVVGPPGRPAGVASTFSGRWNRLHACTALLDVEAMTVDVVVPEEHPLNGLHPVRAPVWWGWKGDVGKRCGVEVHTGRHVVLRIEKRFNRFERLLAKMLRAPNEVRRPLDAMNSLIWELADGTRDFQTIVHHLNASFEEEATPVVERSTAAVRGFVALGVMKLLPSAGEVPWSIEPGAVPPEQNLDQRVPDMDQWP